MIELDKLYKIEASDNPDIDAGDTYYADFNNMVLYSVPIEQYRYPMKIMDDVFYYYSKETKTWHILFNKDPEFDHYSKQLYSAYSTWLIEKSLE